MAPRFRKTRFVCVSDTHNQTPKLPAGDVLIHAGDLTKQGSYKELKRTIDWLEKADFEAKIVVAGNHDITLDTPFYESHGAYFHSQNPQSPSSCQALLTESPTITYLCHDFAEVCLARSTRPRTHFRVFGSPYSPTSTPTNVDSPNEHASRPRHNKWAFQYPTPQTPSASALWGGIPLSADIVVTHTPPQGHRDASARPRADQPRSRGCEELRKALWRVRPRLAVCGHCHEGRGAERVRWRLDLPFSPYMEERTAGTLDEKEGKGLARVDLTGKRGPELDWAEQETPWHGEDWHSDRHEDGAQAEKELIRAATADERLHRRETCIVNAAIVGSSFGMPERSNKPIVVDLDLPVCEHGEEHLDNLQ